MVGNAAAVRDFVRDQVFGHARDIGPCGAVFSSLFHDCLGTFVGSRWVTARREFDPMFSTSAVSAATVVMLEHITAWIDAVAQREAGGSPTLLHLSGCDEIPMRVLTAVVFGGATGYSAPAAAEPCDVAVVEELMALQRQLTACMFHPLCRVPGYRWCVWTRPNRLMATFQTKFRAFFDKKVRQCRSGGAVNAPAPLLLERVSRVRS